jgi:hypothetical protein
LGEGADGADQDGAGDELELPEGDGRDRVAGGNHLALLGQFDPAVDGAGGWARMATLVGPPPRPREPPRPWKKVVADAPLGEERGERFLRGPERPRRAEVAELLVGVGVANHHLLGVALGGERRLVHGLVQEGGEGLQGVAQSLLLLEQGHDLQGRPVAADGAELGLLHQEEDGQAVRGALAAEIT